MANWQYRPFTMAWVDPEDYILSNTANTYLQIQPLKPDFSQGVTGVQFGHRAERSTVATGTTTYSAYWLEWNGSTQQYHALSESLAPGSTSANGLNHTLLVLGDGGAGQWDLLYDYNSVATTSLQAGGSTRISRSSMAVRYPHAITAATPTTFRTQLMDGNQVWRKPHLGEVGTGEPKTCETPPRYEDWTYDVVNLPPGCFTAAYTTEAGATSTDPARLTSFTVGKPSTSVAAAKAAPVPAPVRSGTYNGVDQARLAACLQTDPDSCLEQVPGLATCVAARLTCNSIVAPKRTASPPKPMAAQEAVRQAERTFEAVEADRSPVVTTLSGRSARQLKGITVETPVHVVESTSRVHSMAASDQHIYDGYRAVFDSATHQLLQACLGADC